MIKAFLEMTDEDDGNFSTKWHRKYHLVILSGGKEEVGGDSTYFGPLLRMWSASWCYLNTSRDLPAKAPVASPLSLTLTSSQPLST